MDSHTDDIAEGQGFSAQAKTTYHDNNDAIGSSDDSEVMPLSESLRNEKEFERRRIESEVEAFLSNGGTINHIDPNVMADPPKKPTSNYGGQPI